MKYKMTYIFFLLFLLVTIPYVITVFLDEKDMWRGNYDSGYKIISKKEETDLETYLLKILPGQISMDQEEEAVKAQAVVLRTDIIRRMRNKKQIKQEKLPYKTQEDDQYLKTLGNRQYQLMDQKRKKALEETRGKVITWKKHLIEPYFHALSVGTTLDAREWFGKDIPYIREKESLSDIESKDYMSVKIINYETIRDTIKTYTGKEIKIEQLKTGLKTGRTTKNGYVRQVFADTLRIQGEDFAKWFHLASNNFYFEEYKGKVRVICLGKGNGLGMSQYGAGVMAKQGKSFKKILKYYYPKTTITNLYE